MRSKFLFVYYSFILILNIHFSYAQKLTHQEMVADIDSCFEILKNKHPNLYKKYTPIQFDSLQQKLIEKVVDSMDCKEFNRLLLRINGFTDSHTQVLTDKIWGRIHKKDSLPYFLIKEDSLFLQKRIVLSVNNKDVKDVVSEISTNLSWEYSSLLKEKYINSNLPFFFSSFYDIYPPYFIRSKEIDTNVIREDIVKENKILNVADYKQTFNFVFFEKESIAVFYYNSCNIGSDIELFQRALSTAFDIMDRECIKYLFIDVTKNRGGSTEYNRFILKYLNTKKITDGITYRVNKSRAKLDAENMIRGWKEQISKEPFWRRWFLNYKVRRFNNAMLDYMETGVLKDKIVYPRNKKGFKGKVFLIQSRNTYSAAIDFVTNFRRSKAGIVVGEMAGIPVDYCGDAEVYTLSHSGINVVCAMSEYKYNTPVYGINENGFLVPDVTYEVFNQKLDLEDYLKIIELCRNIK